MRHDADRAVVVKKRDTLEGNLLEVIRWLGHPDEYCLTVECPVANEPGVTNGDLSGTLWIMGDHL